MSVQAGRAAVSRLEGAARHWPWPVLALAILVPFVVASGYWVTVFTTLLINAILVVGLNFMLGEAGLLNLGYAAFAGVGAYGTALAMQEWGVGFWIALVFGCVLSVALAVFVALPTVRLSVVYLAIVTLALGEIFGLLVLNLDGLTGGAIGIGGIERPSLFGLDFNDTPTFYCLVLAFAAILVVGARRWERSHFGRAFKYVREDEIAAEASGIDVARTKLLAFSIGAIYAAIGGALIAVQFQALGPETFGLPLTLLVLTMLAVGGSGRLVGALAGAATFTLLPEIFRSLEEYRLLMYGVALALVMRFRPEGIFPARARPHLHDPLAGDTTSESPRERLPAADGPLAEVRGFTKRFGGLTAVDDVSFTVEAQEILSIIGPNGAGKTTLVDMFCGATKPTAGTVTFRGRDIGRARTSARARAGIARTFQRIRVFPELTVLENVMSSIHPADRGGLVAALVRTPRYRRVEARTTAQAHKWLTFMGGDLAERSDELAKYLPYGLQKRLEMARALAMDPDLLILDEPAAGLNSGEKAAMAALMRRIRDDGTAIVLIEHDMALVMGISDRVIVLDNGSCLTEGRPSEVQMDDRVIDAYLGREVEFA